MRIKKRGGGAGENSRKWDVCVSYGKLSRRLTFENVYLLTPAAGYESCNGSVFLPPDHVRKRERERANEREREWVCVCVRERESVCG